MSAIFCPNLCVLRNFQKGMTYTHNQTYINGIILNRLIISKFKYQKQNLKVFKVRINKCWMCIQHLLIRSLILLSSRSANITSPFQMTEDQNRKCSNFVPSFYRCEKGSLALRKKNIITRTLKQITHKNVFI